MTAVRNLVLSALVSLLVVQPVYANGGSYGWSACNWENSLSLNAGRIYVRANGYPPDSLRDGVLNSFNNRINQAIATWNTALNNAGYVVPTDVLRMTDPYGAPQIEVTQYQFGSGSSLWGDATSYSQSGVNSCVMHSTLNDWVGFAHIRTDIHDDWWTQEDSRRAYWEDCPARNFLPAYTCSKDRDFESLLAHELGHALGLPHPEQVDAHQPSLSPNAATIASCSSTNDRATMCALLQRWRSSGQTLHAWDRESFRILETKH